MSLTLVSSFTLSSARRACDKCRSEYIAANRPLMLDVCNKGTLPQLSLSLSLSLCVKGAFVRIVYSWASIEKCLKNSC